MNNFKYIKQLLIVIIVAAISLVYVRVYTVTELEGDFDKHVLPGEMFGVPEKLKEKGFESLYKLPGQTGWDGQFYYYIANDLLGTSDVPSHVDATAYRYQRIGLPLLANTFSKITFQEYVSPTMYYATSLFFILLASYLFADFLKVRGYSPFLSLFWSLGIGVQLTLLNGLPDATADSLLIIAVLMWIRNKWWLFSIFALLAALSREAYILLPFVLFLFSVFRGLKIKPITIKRLMVDNIYFIIPGLLFLSWHIYIRYHFGVSPSEQAANILDYPFVSFFKYFSLSFINQHPLSHNFSGSEVFYLSYFMILMMISVKVLITSYKSLSVNIQPLIITFLLLAILYFCFGDIVMIHYTGYMKAATLFFFVIIFTIALSGKKAKLEFIIFFFVGLIVFNYGLIQRIHPQHISVHQKNVENFISDIPEKAECINDYKYKANMIKLIDTDDNWLNSLIRNMISSGDIKSAKVKITNDSEKTWPITKGFGTVHMSYHWIDNNGKVIGDGLRTKLEKPLLPHESTEMTIAIEYIKSKDKINLVLSPVQEGCAWFYMVK